MKKNIIKFKSKIEKSLKMNNYFYFKILLI